MRPTELVNEVLRRLGVSASRTAHKTYFELSRGVGCEILHREIEGSQCLEAVWSLRLSRANAATNARRAEQIHAQLKAAGGRAIHLRGDGVVRYVGIKFPVPSSLTPAFFDEVAKEAKWVRDSIDTNAIV